MAIEGPLKELGIHDVFQLLDLSRKTGKLTVTSKLRHNGGAVYFDNGAVVYAEIESNPHLLGSLLVRTGKITDADLNRARDMQLRGDARRLGEILVSIGAISERELDRQVRSQVEDVVFELVGWREGYFSFAEGEALDLPTEARVRIPTESLLMEGARRIDEWSRIERKIPHLGVIPAYAPLSETNQEGYLDLMPSEWEVLTAVDGQRDVREVAETLSRSEFDVAKAIFGLESAGLLAIQERATTPEVAPADGANVADLLQRAQAAMANQDSETARRLAESAQASSPHEPGVYLVLGELELNERNAEAAEEHLRRALRIEPMLVRAHRLLGNALALRGQYAEAIEWWRRWIKLGEHSDEDETEIKQVREALNAVSKLDDLLGQSGD